jgi:hypothetical protein
MLNIQVNIPKDRHLTGAAQTIERLCAGEGLIRKIKRTLKSRPGYVHWHYTKDSQPGTLEISLWPKESRIWFSVHDNRRGPWTDDYAARLAAATRRALKPTRRETIS